MKKIIKIAAIVSVVAVGFLAFESVGSRPAVAQMITQTAYSAISEADITVSSSVVTQIDPTQKLDRRAVMVQNTGTNNVICSNSASVTATTGFIIGNTAYTTGYGVPNMIVFPFTSSLKIYCLAAAGNPGTVHVAQIR